MRAKKRLRSGFTTGACAAAAAAAATNLLLFGEDLSTVAIPFPDGKERSFAVHRSRIVHGRKNGCAMASIIKDAGDDPDVTNGAEIIARVEHGGNNPSLPAVTAHKQVSIAFAAGSGVGMVTKPGLPVPVGEPAINPVPRQMIVAAMAPAVNRWAPQKDSTLTVTIEVTDGEKLAEKTLNHRLGIVGGLSILGTTGIVRPVSAEAWTATISASMAVARETGCRQVVLSTGRTSEKAVQKILRLPIEAYAMMGDYLHYSLTAAAENGFDKIHLAAMWAKVLKAAMEIPQTHVRHGALEAEEAAAFIARLTGDAALGERLGNSNTAREIYDRLRRAGNTRAVQQVCRAAQAYVQKVSGLPVEVYLVESPGRVVEHV